MSTIVYLFCRKVSDTTHVCQVRLMYKRVPRNKPALMQHLDDPIIEYIQLYRLDQEHFLSNLPMGKYIVCADYTVRGVIVQVSSHWPGPVNTDP